MILRSSAWILTPMLLASPAVAGMFTYASASRGVWAYTDAIDDHDGSSRDGPGVWGYNASTGWSQDHSNGWQRSGLTETYAAGEGGASCDAGSFSSGGGGSSLDSSFATSETVHLAITASIWAAIDPTAPEAAET